MEGGEQEVSETPSLLKLYQQFGDITSIHGIGRVMTNNSRWKRVMWSGMCLFGLAFAVYQFVITIDDYYSYPVTTEVILQHESKATFPEVTICNLNIKRKSMIDKDLQEMMETYDKAGGTTLDEIRQRLLHNTNADDNESGHQIYNMLVYCYIKAISCMPYEFTHINTAKYGPCYTFKAKKDLAAYRVRAGPSNGFIMELNIEKGEYLPITSTAGVIVIVHQIDEYPFPEDGGILAHPGAVTSIEVKKVITHQLPAPYRNCVDESGHGSTQRNLYPNKKYMQKACMKSCYQLALYEKCKCCDPDVPCDYYNIVEVDKHTTTNITLPKLQSCDPFADFACSAFVEDKFLKGELNCDERCPPSCNSTTFDTFVSSTIWPAKSSFNEFLKKIKKSTRILDNKSFAENASLELYIRSNFLRLEIFLDKLEFLEFTTHAKYDWNLLLGTIGGLLGLWLGFSLLTAMEIVEVLIDTVLYYTRTKHKGTMTSQTE